MNEQITTKISITRPSYSDDEKRCIKISIKDEASRIQFLTIEIDPADFAEALTGLAEVECKGIVKGLDKVGYSKEADPAVIYITKEELDANNILSYSSRHVEEYVKNNPKYQRDGWHLDHYLRSQGSIIKDTNGNISCKVSYYRYV